MSITPEAMAALEGYDWPGNIRQLENLIERMAVLNRHGVIQRADLPVELQQAQGEGVDAPNAGPFDLPALERQTVLGALEKPASTKARPPSSSASAASN